MNKLRNGNSNGMKAWFERTDNIDFYESEGSFVSNSVLQVGARQITGKKIYVNTGTRPRVPKIDGLDEVDWLDNAGLLALEQLPEHLIILGGGYIGVEFSQVYKRFGCEVTIVQRADQLMPREDKDIADAIKEILEDEQIKVLCDTEARSVSQGTSGVELEVMANGERKIIKGSHLLVAIGRVPNSDAIGLENTDIQLNERGYIRVDDHCRTDVKDVYALGDVNGHGAFTHTAVNDAEIVLDSLYGGSRSISKRIPVYGLFTDPPLGRVGMSEKEAVASGKNVLKATYPLSRIGRAKEMGETKGFAKLLVDADTDLIIGGAILGINGDEVINMFAAIMHSGIECRNYRKVVLVHPTVSELMPWMLDGIKAAMSKGA